MNITFYRPLTSQKLASHLRAFSVKAQAWGVQARIGGRRHELQIVSPAGASLVDYRYAHGLFLSTFSSLLHKSSIEKKAFPLPWMEHETFEPLHAGPVLQSRSKGATYSVGHLLLRGVVGIPVRTEESRYRHGVLRDYFHQRIFSFLPQPDHAEHFALASAHSMPSHMNQVLPFAVGFANVLESSSHVILQAVQANFSRRLMRTSPLARKDRILSAEVHNHYSHWRSELLGHVLRYYSTRKKPLLFVTAKELRMGNPNLSLVQAQGIERDIEKAAQALGYSTHELTDAEKKAYGFPRVMQLKTIVFRAPQEHPRE